MRSLGLKSYVCVPLAVSGNTLGVLTFATAESGRRYTDADLAVAADLARRAALAVENARLREQAQQAATLEERQRLARELHDAVTQTLFSASLIAEVIPDLWQSDPDEAARRLEQLQRLTRGALAEMRSLLVELRPGALTEVPLSTLLRQLAEAVAGRTHVEVTITTEGQREKRLPPDVQVAFYRLAQEALNNVAKHARATHAALVLSYRPGGVTLRIADNGQGFNPALIPPGHLGVGIMGERAEAVGAALTIESAAGQGTRIEIDWQDDGEGARP
jgi:signal transduction histidine kinase